MIFDFKTIQEIFNKVKETHDFKEYIDEIKKNESILYAQYFDEQKAQQQVSKLTGKYYIELNALAHYYNNGMFVTNSPVSKSEKQIYDDLSYINNHIPLFAIERTGVTNYLKQYENIGGYHG